MEMVGNPAGLGAVHAVVEVTGVLAGLSCDHPDEWHQLQRTEVPIAQQVEAPRSGLPGTQVRVAPLKTWWWCQEMWITSTVGWWGLGTRRGLPARASTARPASLRAT